MDTGCPAVPERPSAPSLWKVLQAYTRAFRDLSGGLEKPDGFVSWVRITVENASRTSGAFGFPQIPFELPRPWTMGRWSSDRLLSCARLLGELRSGLLRAKFEVLVAR